MQDIMIKSCLIITADETYQAGLLIANGVIPRLGVARTGS
jgi:hypothetical protein